MALNKNLYKRKEEMKLLNGKLYKFAENLIRKAKDI